MNIYIVTHVFQGVLQDVRAFTKEDDADKYKEKPCEENDLPCDDQKRHMTETDDDIVKWTVELQ